MLIHMCTATFQSCEIRQDPYLCRRSLLTLVVMSGELFGSSLPSSVCSIADFGL